jgi:hypothetical protein
MGMDSPLIQVLSKFSSEVNDALPKLDRGLHETIMGGTSESLLFI